MSGSGAVGAGSRLAALALVLLVLNAAYASAAHTHLAAPARDPQSGRSLGARDASGTEQARDEASRCLLCRLQRNLSSSLGTPAQLFIRPSQCSLTPPEVSHGSPQGVPPGVPSGRAPPLS